MSCSLATCVLGVVLLGGCAGFGRSARGPVNQSDRLMATYPELAAGRFWVVADFEQIEHYQLFHVVSHSGNATSIPSNSAGVPETGPRCLRVTLADPLDALVVGNSQASTWSMRRDWRDFHLLLAAVQSPADAVDLEVAVTGGPLRTAATAQTRVRLQQGWNVLRLDLVEMAERLPVDDVREVQFSLPQSREPVALVFDDLILADNREDVFGSPDDPEEGLFVQRQGRRVNVGAAGRFELGFAGGQIVHWYDLGSDPHRLRNQAGGGLLGPAPVVLSGIPYDPDTTLSTDFGALGETIVAHQEVVEANPVRIVVACTLRYTADGQPVEETSPFQRWTYTILRTGQVYAYIESATEFGDWQPEGVGLIASLAEIDPGQTWAVHAPEASRSEGDPPLVYAVARPNAADRSGLLLALHKPSANAVADVFTRQGPRRLDLFVAEADVARPTARWACLLSVWPPGNTDPPAALALARDYAHPTPPQVHVGRLCPDAPGDADHDGFDERFGVFTVEPEGDLVRVEIDGRDHPRVQPVFAVCGTAGRQVWVYFDNAILEPTARDVNDNVIFQIPTTVQRRSVVEVILRRSGGASNPAE